MKILQKTIILAILIFSVIAFTTSNSTKYKCMIQLKNYDGEGAYIVVSLLNPKGEYEKTLQVLGDDAEWYKDITNWWNFYSKNKTNIDAITGATISGGQRAIKIIEIDNDKINSGYKIRFETAVEDKEYYTDDVTFELTSENIKKKKKGTGFIRYIRMLPQ